MKNKRVNIDRMKMNVRAPLFDCTKEEEGWRFFDITNCYSYALGVFEDIDFLRPGEISEMEYKSVYTDEELLERVISDLIALGLEVTVSNGEEIIDDEYSWKIAVLNGVVDGNYLGYDYHFLKQGRNQKWFHKHPYDQCPTQYDSRNKVIENPETATYLFCYHLVEYLVVRQV